MRILESKRKLCSCCMKIHNVKRVTSDDVTIFKGETVHYIGEYLYCDRANELYMTEDQTVKNDINIKNAYRKRVGLLTSYEIKQIREKYGVTQKNLCEILGWGDKTITRYESHQVQDRAHDIILRKINDDPEWFMELLKMSENKISKSAYKKCYSNARSIYKADKDIYVQKAVLVSTI